MDRQKDGQTDRHGFGILTWKHVGTQKISTQSSKLVVSCRSLYASPDVPITFDKFESSNCDVSYGTDLNLTWSVSDWKKRNVYMSNTILFHAFCSTFFFWHFFLRNMIYYCTRVCTIGAFNRKFSAVSPTTIILMFETSFIFFASTSLLEYGVSLSRTENYVTMPLTKYWNITWCKLMSIGRKPNTFGSLLSWSNNCFDIPVTLPVKSYDIWVILAMNCDNFHRRKRSRTPSGKVKRTRNDNVYAN